MLSIIFALFSCDLFAIDWSYVKVIAYILKAVAWMKRLGFGKFLSLVSEYYYIETENKNSWITLEVKKVVCVLLPFRKVHCVKNECKNNNTTFFKIIDIKQEIEW